MTNELISYRIQLLQHRILDDKHEENEEHRRKQSILNMIDIFFPLGVRNNYLPKIGQKRDETEAQATLRRGCLSASNSDIRRRSMLKNEVKDFTTCCTYHLVHW